MNRLTILNKLKDFQMILYNIRQGDVDSKNMDRMLSSVEYNRFMEILDVIRIDIQRETTDTMEHYRDDVVDFIFNMELDLGEYYPEYIELLKYVQDCILNKEKVTEISMNIKIPVIDVEEPELLKKLYVSFSEKLIQLSAEEKTKEKYKEIKNLELILNYIKSKIAIKLSTLNKK